jgi:hypothetical protein
MDNNRTGFKGNITTGYTTEKLENLSGEVDELISYLPGIETQSGNGRFIELSRYYSDASIKLLDSFDEGTFISCDPFNALLVHHVTAIKQSSNVETWHIPFTVSSLQDKTFNESASLLFSLSGLTWEDYYTLVPGIMNMTAVGGLIYLEFPAYWFIRDDLNDDENAILAFSKKNDKKWLFSEPVEPLFEENGAELVELTKSSRVINCTRLEIARLSCLHTLEKADLENNIAITDTCNIAENDLQIPVGRMVFRKKAKTLNRDNLFSV